MKEFISLLTIEILARRRAFNLLFLKIRFFVKHPGFRGLEILSIPITKEKYSVLLKEIIWPSYGRYLLKDLIKKTREPIRGKV